ncbi:MAG TPA: ABC transporter substrate-binding protein [Spirochaetia bacterium]|nr:ABC transporter substrate-binding protein [Spirochaetia bacterium]
MSMFRLRRRYPIILAAVTALILVAALAGCGASSSTSSVPSQITIGTLYAQSGAFATSSMPQYQGLQFWASQVNKDGGVMVKAYGKKIPIVIKAYNDGSTTATAGTLYNQLITQDKVNVLVADFGSVLTSVAVPIAKENKMLLFDPTGTGASFFTPDNPYLVLTSLPSSGVWPTSLANMLLDQKISKVAVVYASNDFDQSQAETLKSILAGGGVTPVYYQAVDTGTKDYGVILKNIAASKPDAVIEFGYNLNDIAFLQGIKNGGYHFPMVFTVFPGQQYALIQKSVGNAGLQNTYTYPTPPLFGYNQVNYGLGMNDFTKAYEAANNVTDVNFLNIAGYNAGLVIQKALETSASLKQEDLRAAVTAFSDNLNTLDGHFKIDANGAQMGETLPVSQFQPAGGNLKSVIVYPTTLATGKAIYPAH